LEPVNAYLSCVFKKLHFAWQKNKGVIKILTTWVIVKYEFGSSYFVIISAKPK